MSEIEWKGIVLIGVIMMAAFAILKLLEKKTNIRGELKRKTFHITMGLMVLSFPYVFQNRYSVVVVGVLCFILFDIGEFIYLFFASYIIIFDIYIVTILRICFY